MGNRIQMTANRIVWPCGCSEWDELQGGIWYHMRCHCFRHPEKVVRGD